MAALIGNSHMTKESRPSALSCQVYQQHIEHFGEPHDGIVFDDSTAANALPDHLPPRIEVLVWHPTPDLDISTFSTIGMSDKPMRDAEHRAELHFAVRMKLSPHEINACARFLANVANYPFHYGTHFDWWHKLLDPGAIPLFVNAKSILLHPRFVDDGWDHIHCEDGTHVKLLNVMPISAEAYKLKSRQELMDYLWDELGDPFTPW